MELVFQVCEALHSQAAFTGKGAVGVKSSQPLGVLQNAERFPCSLHSQEIHIAEPANHSCCSESLKAEVGGVVHSVNGALERCAAAILPLQFMGCLELQAYSVFPLSMPLLLRDGDKNLEIRSRESKPDRQICQSSRAECVAVLTELLGYLPESPSVLLETCRKSSSRKTTG